MVHRNITFEIEMSRDTVNFFDYTDDCLACPLSRAVIAHDIAAFQLILNKRRKNPQPLSADNRKWTAFHIAASQKHSTAFLDLLIQFGNSIRLNINAETFDGRTALFIACERGCDENVCLLLQNGCNPAMKKLDGTTALHVCAQKGFASTVDYLLRSSSLQKSPRRSVGIDDQDWQGFTSLHLAAMYGHINVCHLLLKYKAKLQVTDNDGNIPLHLACQNGYFHIVRLLLEKDFTLINHENLTGITPLMLAVKSGEVECVRYLLNHGAKTDMINNDKIIPLQFAIVGGNKDILELILKNTKYDIIEQHCFQNFTKILDNRGMFYSLVCCALNSGSVECLSAILKSGFPRKILEAPYAENSGYCLDVFSPLAYLFSSFSAKSVDETFDSFLHLLLKHNIVYMKEFISKLKFQWPISCVKFINPYNIIFSREWPSDKILPYFHLLNEHNITPDYCLMCYNYNSESFKEFKILFGYFEFYKPVLDAVYKGDIDTVRLFLSHSSILEPDKLCQYLLEKKSSESSKEFNNNLKKMRSLYHYLVRLKPSRYNYEKSPRNVRFFDSFSRNEEFSRSNLQQLCRSVIREHLRGSTIMDNLTNFRNKILQLPLPTSMKDYLLFKS